MGDEEIIVDSLDFDSHMDKTVAVPVVNINIREVQ